MSVDVASLVVAITGDTTSLRAALVQGEAQTRAFAATATTSAQAATAALREYDGAVAQSVTSTQKLGEETVRYSNTTRQTATGVTNTATTVRRLGDEVTRTTIVTREGDSALAALAARNAELKASLAATAAATREGEQAFATLQTRLMALSQLSAIPGLGGIGNIAGIGQAATGMEALAGSEAGVTAGLAALSVGALAAGAGVLALGVALVGAAGHAAEFQTQLSRAQANTTMTTAETNAMRDAIVQMSQQSGASLADLGAGYVHISNIMGSAADAVTVLDVAQQSAVSTGGNVADSAQTLARVLHEFGMSAGEASAAMDMLHTAAAAGDLTLSQFTENSGQSLAMAANYGVKLDQVTAAYIALTKHGMSAADANTQIADGMLRLTTVTPKVATELERVTQLTGVNLVDDFTSAGLATKGYTGILADLRDAYTKMGLTSEQATAESMLLGDALRGGRGLAILAGTGYADYQSTLAQVDDTTASAAKRQDDYNRYLQTTAGEVDQLKAKLDALAVTVGGPVNVAFGGLLGGINADITAVQGLGAAFDALGQSAAGAIGIMQQATAASTAGSGNAGGGWQGNVGRTIDAAGGFGGLATQAVAGAVAAVPGAGAALALIGGLRDLSLAHKAEQEQVNNSAAATVAYDQQLEKLQSTYAGSIVPIEATTESLKSQEAQLKSSAATMKATIGELANQHAALGAQLATVKAGYAAVIAPMQAQVTAADQSFAEAGLQATVGTDQAKDRYQPGIQSMQAVVTNAQQGLDEAGLRATVASDQVKDQYAAPIKAAQDALTDYQAQHATASAEFAQEAADAHAAHDATIHQLEQQITLMTDQNKYAREAVQLTDQIAQNEASIAQSAALGDPVKRAKDEGTIAQAQAVSAVAAAHANVQALTYQLARTPDNARNHDVYVQAQSALTIAKAQLDEAQQVNPAALGKATTQSKEAASKASADSAKAGIATARTALAAIPYQQALDGEKTALQNQLDTIQRQKDAYDAIYTKTLPGLQAALDLVKGQEAGALAVIAAQLRTKQEQVDQIKADLVPQINAQTAAEKLAVDQIAAQLRAKQEVVDKLKADLVPQINAQTAAEVLAIAPINTQLTQIASVEAAWKTAKDNVDAYNKSLAAGDPVATAALLQAQNQAQITADAATIAANPGSAMDTGLSGAVGGQAGGATGTISAVAGASVHVDAYHDAAAKDASQQIGQNIVNKCEQFVDDVFGVQNRVGRGTAVDAANLFATQGTLHGGSASSAPIGARLYYADANALGQIVAGAGHVAIKTAADLMTGSDANGVESRHISTWQQQAHERYLGYYVDPTNGRTPSAFGTGGGGSGVPGASQGSGNVYITIADGAVRIDGGAGNPGDAQAAAAVFHAALRQAAQDVTRTLSAGAPLNVPGNVRA